MYHQKIENGEGNIVFKISYSDQSLAHPLGVEWMLKILYQILERGESGYLTHITQKNHSIMHKTYDKSSPVWNVSVGRDLSIMEESTVVSVSVIKRLSQGDDIYIPEWFLAIESDNNFIHVLPWNLDIIKDMRRFVDVNVVEDYVWNVMENFVEKKIKSATTTDCSEYEFDEEDGDEYEIGHFETRLVNEKFTEVLYSNIPHRGRSIIARLNPIFVNGVMGIKRKSMIPNCNKKQFLIVSVGSGYVDPQHITRHSAGTAFLDMMAEAYRIRDSFKSISEIDRVLISDTIMMGNTQVTLAKIFPVENLTGEILANLMLCLGIWSDSVCVVYSQADMYEGEVKFSITKNHHGNRDLKDIVEALGRSEFPTVKIGVTPRIGRGKNGIGNPRSISEWKVFLKELLPKRECANMYSKATSKAIVIASLIDNGGFLTNKKIIRFSNDIYKFKTGFKYVLHKEIIQ